MNELPPQLKVEVKFTTSAGVSIPTREREALRPDADGAVGVIAVMCLCGDRELDGRWILVDPEDAFGRRKPRRYRRGLQTLRGSRSNSDAFNPSATPFPAAGRRSCRPTSKTP